jgi:phosphoglycolate phosphatase
MAAAVNAAGRYRMEKKMKIDSLIFDLDGTLWDSSEGIVATWALVLEHYPEIHKKVTAEELASNFGLPLDQIARNMFPEQTEALRMRLMDECCEQENIYLAEHGGLLYPKLEETLQKLSEKYPLFIVSNCQDGYIQSFYSGNHTAKYFKDCECIGVTGKSKGANIRLVMERNGLKSPVYIGDTQGDADAAAQAGIPFIYAAYGFGQVKAFDAEIHTFEELLDIVE